MRLSRKFYRRNTETVAKGLLGKVLVRKTVKGAIKGKIVETEAYLGAGDPGAIGSRKVKNVPNSLLKPPGHAFVYFTYGNHWMLNIIAKRGALGAVLIRALEPLQGIELMKKWRGTYDVRNLTNGPGKLTEAFGIGKGYDGTDLVKGQLFIEDGKGKVEMIRTTRIGLSKGKERLLRFYIKGNEYVSK